MSFAVVIGHLGQLITTHGTTFLSLRRGHPSILLPFHLYRPRENYPDKTKISFEKTSEYLCASRSSKMDKNKWRALWEHYSVFSGLQTTKTSRCEYGRPSDLVNLYREPLLAFQWRFKIFPSNHLSTGEKGFNFVWLLCTSQFGVYTPWLATQVVCRPLKTALENY